MNALGEAVVALLLQAYCAAKHAEYDALQATCGACNQECAGTTLGRIARCAESLVKLACWQEVLILRTQYWAGGCDFVMTTYEWDPHLEQITIVQKAMANCATLIATTAR
jgi:hypothetical protein